MAGHSHRHALSCYWVTKNRSVWQKLKEDGKPVLLLYRLSSVWKVMRARFTVISSSLTDIDIHLVKGSTVIQTFHGIPNQKTVCSVMRHNMAATRSRFDRVITGIGWHIFKAFNNQLKFDYVIAPSEAVIPIWCDVFDTDRSKIQILGMPRDDDFYGEDEAALKKLAQTVVSYIPTHRSGYRSKVAHFCELLRQYGFDKEAFDSFMKAHNIKFVAKPHYRHPDRDDLREMFRDCENLVVYDGEDVTPLLKETDILITDYSTVFHSFLHMDRPIVFAPFDFEEYERATGFYEEYFSYTPGYKCRSWQEVLEKIEESLETDAFAEQRKCVRNKIYRFQDGRNCERICDWIESLNTEMTGSKKAKRQKR